MSVKKKRITIVTHARSFAASLVWKIDEYATPSIVGMPHSICGQRTAIVAPQSSEKACSKVTSSRTGVVTFSSHSSAFGLQATASPEERHHQAGIEDATHYGRKPTGSQELVEAERLLPALSGLHVAAAALDFFCAFLELGTNEHAAHLHFDIRVLPARPRDGRRRRLLRLRRYPVDAEQQAQASLALQPTAFVAGTELCALSTPQVAGIQGVMSGANSSCAFNLTVDSVLRLKADDEELVSTATST